MCREVLELEARALKHSSERFIGAESRRHRVGSLVAEHIGDIDELQVGLAGERFKRLRKKAMNASGSSVAKIPLICRFRSAGVVISIGFDM